jgi:hypothetical protein
MLYVSSSPDGHTILSWATGCELWLRCCRGLATSNLMESNHLGTKECMPKEMHTAEDAAETVTTRHRETAERFPIRCSTEKHHACDGEGQPADQAIREWTILQCISMLAMTQLFFRQQPERHNDQTATRICGKRRVKAEQKPVCYGYEKDAQSVVCQRETARPRNGRYSHRSNGSEDRARPRDEGEKGCHRD